MVALVGSACGTTITNVLNTTPTIKMLGLVLGAAIPPFVETIGRHRHLRVAMAVLVTIAATTLTYAAASAVGSATSQEIVPPPKEIIQHLVSWPTPAAPGIEVTPQPLVCEKKCNSAVTVKSVGTAPLVIGRIEFDGAARKSFTQSGECENKRLDKAETCAIKVSFSPHSTADDENARLVIHQNLPGDPTYIDLIGRVSPSGPDLVLIAKPISCSYESTSRTAKTISAQIDFQLRLIGPSGGLPDKTLVSISGPAGSTKLTPPLKAGSQTLHAQLTLPKVANDNQLNVKMVVDPAGAIREVNEDNNLLLITIELPTAPESNGVLDCRAS